MSCPSIMEKYLVGSLFLGTQGSVFLLLTKLSLVLVIYRFINTYASFLLNFTFCFII